MSRLEERTLNKLESIDARLDSLDTKLAVYNEQLKIHIKRTELLEDDIRPIKDHVSQVKGAGKLVALISTIMVIFAGVYAITGV